MINKTDKQQDFIELRAKGNSFDTIAKQLEVSKGTLINWSRDLEDEIQNYSALELDTLKEKYLISKKHQIQSYGEQLATVREELSSRDLSDVKTEKLIEVEIKLLEAINKLGITTTLTGEGMSLKEFNTSWEI
jgi:hypothetical protein